MAEIEKRVGYMLKSREEVYCEICYDSHNDE